MLVLQSKRGACEENCHLWNLIWLDDLYRKKTGCMVGNIAINHLIHADDVELVYNRRIRSSSGEHMIILLNLKAG